MGAKTRRPLRSTIVRGNPGKRKAHYHFTVKGNQPGVLEDLKLYFQDRGEAHFVEHTPPDHGRVETRKIWTTTELNDYLHFPHVAQAFVIRRPVQDQLSSSTNTNEQEHGSTWPPGMCTVPKSLAAA